METSRVCVYECWVGSGRRSSWEGANTAILGTGPLVFFPTEVAMCKLSWTSVSVLWPSIKNCVPRG